MLFYEIRIKFMGSDVLSHVMYVIIVDVIREVLFRSFRASNAFH